MERLYEYIDTNFVYHHSIDRQPDPTDFPMHAHDTHELFYFLSGHGNYLVEGNPYPLRPGDLILLRTGEAHKLQIQSDRPYERKALSFHDTALASLRSGKLLLEPFYNRRLGDGNLYTAAELHNTTVGPCFQNLEDLARKGEPALAFSCFLPPILYEIRTIFLSRGTAVPPADLTAEIVEYINLHLCQDLSLDSISQRFYISKTHLNRLFRRAIGASVWEYITVKRLMLCRSKITAGVPAGKASVQCGFRDYSTFYRSYQKRFHAAPTQDVREQGNIDFPAYF